MDQFTENHLDAWLMNQEPNENDRVEVRAMMVWGFENDPEYWSNMGWPSLWTAVKKEMEQ